jgi:hypothetical protein
VGRSPVVPCRGSHGGAQRIAHRPARCRRGVAVTPASGRSVNAEWMSIRWSLAAIRRFSKDIVENASLCSQ